MRKPKKIFYSARKGLGTSLGLQCCPKQETKVNYSLFSFLYLLSPYSARLCAPCELTVNFLAFPSVKFRKIWQIGSKCFTLVGTRLQANL